LAAPRALNSQPSTFNAFSTFNTAGGGLDFTTIKDSSGLILCHNTAQFLYREHFIRNF
jgi:hypothetical protein